MSLLLISLGGIQEKTGLESESSANGEVTPDVGKIQWRPQQSRARFQKQRQRPGQRQGLVHGDLKIGQSSFPNQTIRFLQLQGRRRLRRPPRPGRLSHLIGVLQAAHPAIGGGCNG
jgi:hypothetical protein